MNISCEMISVSVEMVLQVFWCSVEMIRFRWEVTAAVLCKQLIRQNSGISSISLNSVKNHVYNNASRQIASYTNTHCYHMPNDHNWTNTSDGTFTVHNMWPRPDVMIRAMSMCLFLGNFACICTVQSDQIRARFRTQFWLFLFIWDGVTAHTHTHTTHTYKFVYSYLSICHLCKWAQIKATQFPAALSVASGFSGYLCSLLVDYTYSIWYNLYASTRATRNI